MDMEQANGTKFTRDRRSAQKGGCPVVYFYLVNRYTAPTFKIGYTEDFAKRDKQHRAAQLAAVQLDTLCNVRATKADEQSIHKIFGRFRIPDQLEIFQADEQIADWIRWLRDQYYVWVPDDDKCERIEEMPIEAFDNWKPGEGRSKKYAPEESLFAECPILAFPPRKVTVDDFYTGEIILEAARATFGGIIDLDPASHPVANGLVRASSFYSIADDGLKLPWRGNVWLNPPFSQWRSWVPKIIEEVASGRVKALCLLCATRTLSAQYFAPVRERASAMCIINGRIPFWGERASSPDDGHAIFYFGADVTAFHRAFSPLGTISLSYASVGMASAGKGI